MILTLPDHDERRRIINKMHRTKDKDLCRRLNAILLLADGHSVSAVSRLTAAARSSITRGGLVHIVRSGGERSERLKLFVVSCNEAGYDSRLGNNEIPSLKQIGLNSVTKNRTPKDPNLTNRIKQRTAADVGMVLGFMWSKEEQGAGANV
ncbi:hypothetical protein GCM10027295_07350 [Pseudaeromonas pectinilytica]